MAKAEKRNGKNVNLRFLKIEIDGKWFDWDTSKSELMPHIDIARAPSRKARSSNQGNADSRAKAKFKESQQLSSGTPMDQGNC